MAKRTGNSSVNSSIRQSTALTQEGMSQLLAAQQASLGELSSIKKLLELSKDIKKSETSSAAAPDTDVITAKLLDIAKDQLKGSRRYWKTQDEFQVEWDKEAKNIAEMAKGMKTFKTFGEKMADKKEGLKEKFGSAGGLKKTVLGALNVGGIFNKTLERDKFVEQQRALGSTASTKDLKKDYEGAAKASKATKKTEAQIEKIKSAAANGGPEVSEEQLKSSNPEFAKLLEKRQSNADEFGKYQRATDIYSPTPVNRNLIPTPAGAKAVPAAVGLSNSSERMSNIVATPSAPELGKTPTSTAAEATQGAETAEEGKRMEEEQLNLLKTIAENTGGDKKDDNKKVEPAKAEGGGFLDTIMSFLGTGLMTAFKALLNPMNILKALGKVFAIGMIIGALFEGVMDGFDEFMKTGDIGKALIAGLAGIIDFLTFGLFDKEKIKQVIGDFSKWTYDHLVKPFVDFITSIKDSFMKLIENIGVPEIKFKIPIVGKEVSIGPFYPFKSDAKPTPAAPTAAAPTTANQVELQSAENAGAKETPAPSNKTNVVNAPVTTNNNTTQVQMRPPIRNVESSQSRYAESRYA